MEHTGKRGKSLFLKGISPRLFWRQGSTLATLSTIPSRLVWTWTASLGEAAGWTSQALKGQQYFEDPTL